MRMFKFFVVAGVLAGFSACGGGSTEDGGASAKQADPSKRVERTAASFEGVAPDMIPVLERSLARDPGPTNEFAVIRTTYGDIKIRFFGRKAPIAVANFKGLVVTGYYKNVLIHRVIKGFMMQGGDPTGTGDGGESLWGRPFDNEITPTLKFNRPGLIAMAKPDRPRSNTSQFFITEGPAEHLDGKHTIFGEVMEGMDVVSKICGLPTDKGDRPLERVEILDVFLTDQY